ncbi:unnamed protein product [Effrenium voratum]|nr:unnamed protein product [Effrenium voratum]CAJ1461178.1 unnamed protein product [Effrenium voratum]
MATLPSASRSFEELLGLQSAALRQSLAFNQALSQKCSYLLPQEVEDVRSGYAPSNGCSPSAACCDVDLEQAQALRRPLLSQTSGLGGREESPVFRRAPVEQAKVSVRPTKELKRSPSCTPGGSSRLFGVDDMRRKLRDSLKKEKKAGEDIYRVGAWSTPIARSSLFNAATLVVIISNSIWIAVDIDLNKANVLWEAPLPFQIVENLFCAFFTFEMVVRISSLKTWSSAMDGWFLFDASLTVMMIWDTWVTLLIHLFSGSVVHSGVRSFTILRILRILRIFRVARAARIINSLPELRVLVQGMAIAMRSTSTLLAMLLLVVYIYAVLFTQLLAGTPDTAGWFDCVPQAMNFLLLQTLSGADVQVINKLLGVGLQYYFVYLSFVFVGSLTLMNMLIGVLCEVVTVVAQVEEERSFNDQAEIYLRKLVSHLDEDGDDRLTRSEFMQLVESEDHLIQGLENFGIDVLAFCDHAIEMFSENESMNVGDFVELVTQFRGQKNTTVKDLVDIRKFISMQLRHATDEIISMQDADQPELKTRTTTLRKDNDSVEL